MLLGPGLQPLLAVPCILTLSISVAGVTYTTCSSHLDNEVQGLAFCF